MRNPDTTRALWQIHFCVLLWGFTAILGKLISLPALPLVWWRMLIVVAALVLLPKVWRGLRAMPARSAPGLCRDRRAGGAALADLLRRDQAGQRLGGRHLHRVRHPDDRADRAAV